MLDIDWMASIIIMDLLTKLWLTKVLHDTLTQAGDLIVGSNPFKGSILDASYSGLSVRASESG